MSEVWQWAILVAAIGIMSGLAGAGILMMALTKGRADDPLYRDSARSLAILWFAVFSTVGLILAASIVNRDSFEDVPAALRDLVPQLIVAGLILVVGRALALAAGSYVARTVAVHSRVREQASLLVRTTVTAAAVVIAVDQVGIDTTLLQIIGAAIVFGLAAAAALLVGLGGRDMAAEVAAGRYLSRMLHPGDQIELSLGPEVVTGTVVGLHPASVELLLADGSNRLISNSQVFSANPRLIADGD